ncbi:hypothetical protein [Methylobacterium marchantiae]|uniref:Secreted protein n=1 Tax=Methylobacterium marchantiae TaxID=600331 RepID=A0ABW3X0W2_9HYPH|nr:hypothetical protein AIGOOFII_3629 [Methylobacterium marchantiae]
MMRSTRWGAACLLALAAGAARADDARREVVACETLVSLRVLMGQTQSDHDQALAALPGHPGCRTVARDRVGAAEHRAMIGGAPFECLAVKDEPSCLWIMP